jgi:hypothetical protein
VNALPGQGFDRRCEIEVAVGCSLLLRADVLRQVGLLDETYFTYHEDVDWCLRAHKLGYRFYYEPMSRVFHRPSSSTTKLQEGNVPVPPGTTADDLPNAEPLPWNPIRTYLGARNLIRLLRTYATPVERRAFVHSCLYEIPLEVLAIIHDREGWMRLHRWRYGDALRMTFVDHHPSLQPGAPFLTRLLTFAITAPVDLLWRLPRRAWSAYHAGRFTQLRYHLQGLIDGVRNRPLPLAWLGLDRQAAPCVSPPGGGDVRGSRATPAARRQGRSRMPSLSRARSRSPARGSRHGRRAGCRGAARTTGRREGRAQWAA